MTRVILVGFMGSGKSTIGKELANLLALPLIEMDKEIETLAGQSISAIFEEVGEEGFRRLETQVLKDALKKQGIIATGGGIVTQKENLALLNEEKVVIYLKGNLSTLINHIEKDQVNQRPLVKDISSLTKLFEKREEAYESVATDTIIIDQKSVSEIVVEIKSKGLI